MRMYRVLLNVFLDKQHQLIFESSSIFNRTGKTYLSYKTDDNAIAQRSRIWLREVQEDGITFAENSSPTLIMSADLEEDKLVVEGGSLLYRHGYYYLFFSADGYLSPTYHINVARSKTVLISQG